MRHVERSADLIQITLRIDHVISVRLVCHLVLGRHHLRVVRGGRVHLRCLLVRVMLRYAV